MREFMGKPSFSSQRFDKDHFILDFFDNEFSKMEISVFSESKNMYLADQGKMTPHENKWKVTPEYPELPLTSKMILDFNDAFLYSLNMQSKHAPFQVYVYLNDVKQKNVLVISNPKFPSCNVNLDIRNAVGTLRFFDGKIIRKRFGSSSDFENVNDSGLLQSDSASEVSSDSAAKEEFNDDSSDKSRQHDKEKLCSEENKEKSPASDFSDDRLSRQGDLSLDNDSRFDTSYDAEQYRYVPPNFYVIVLPFVLALIFLVLVIVAVYYFI